MGAVEKVIGSKLVGAGPTLHCWSNRPAAVVPWPQDGEVDAALISGRLGTGAAGREEKALYFGDEVDEKKFTSCKPRGNDPRSLNDFTTEDIEKMNNVSFSDPEYTNKVLLVVNLASF